jgi:hypothetical protein
MNEMVFCVCVSVQMVARKKREGSFEPKPQLSKIKKEEEERYGEENEPLDMNKFQTLDEYSPQAQLTFHTHTHIL